MFTTCDVDLATPVVTGGDQARRARGCAVHRHRPDGPEALRRQGQASRSASATWRRTRAPRWPSTRIEGLAVGATSRPTRCRLLQERRPGVRDPVQAARRQDRRQGELRDRRQQRRGGREPAERAEGRRRRHLDGVRRAAGARLRPAGARQQHAGAQLGGRRHLLGDEEPADHELLRGHVRVDLRGRPEPGRALPGEAVEGGDRRLRHRLGRDRRRRHRDRAGRAARRAGSSSPGSWRSSPRCRRSPAG